MRVNKQKLWELMALVAPGRDGKACYNRFAKLTKLSVGSLHRVLNSDQYRGGAGMFGTIKMLCDQHGLDFNDYVIWEEEEVDQEPAEELPLPNPAVTVAIAATMLKMIERAMDLIILGDFPLGAETVIETHLHRVCEELDKYTED